MESFGAKRRSFPLWVVDGHRFGKRKNLFFGNRKNPNTIGAACLGDIPALLHKIRCLHESIHLGASQRSLKKELTSVCTLMKSVTHDTPATAGHKVRRVDGSRIWRREGETPRSAFVLSGGVNLLKDIMYSAHHAHTNSAKMSEADKRNPAGVYELSITVLCVELLYELGAADAQVASDLSTDAHIFTVLFWLLQTIGYHGTVANFLEEILACREYVYSLADAPGFKDLLQDKFLSDVDLVHFCRVFAVLVFDSDDMAEKSTAMERVKKNVLNPAIVPEFEPPPNDAVLNPERNQELLASLPGLVARLVGLVRISGNVPLLLALMRTPDFISIVMQVLVPEEGHDTTTQVIHFFNAIYSHQPESADFATLFGGTDETSQMRKEIMRIALYRYYSEVLFTLCTLAGCSKKREVQSVLLQSNIGAILSEIVDYLEWGSASRRPVLHVHGPSCTCNPESSLKTQLLRLVRSFCDVEHDSDYRYKHALLTTAEVAEVQCMHQTHDIAHPDDVTPGSTASPEAAVLFPVSQHCTGRHGLIAKLVRLFIARDTTNDNLYSIAHSLEGYLRGMPEADRMWLVSLGLLQSITTRLLDGTAMSHQGCFQSLFDLLAEIIRFCPAAVVALDGILQVDDHAETLRRHVASNLVASNVFLRSLCLTLHVPYGPRHTTICPAMQRTGLVAFLGNADSLGRLLSDLIMSVTVATVCQESVCCISTCIVFFMVARADGGIPHILRSIHGQRDGQGTHTLWNWKQLLTFWRDFYSDASRIKDQQSLERNSKHLFSEWAETVAILLGDDRVARSTLADGSAAADLPSREGTTTPDSATECTTPLRHDADAEHADAATGTAPVSPPDTGCAAHCTVSYWLALDDAASAAE